MKLTIKPWVVWDVYSMYTGACLNNLQMLEQKIKNKNLEADVK